MNSNINSIFEAKEVTKNEVKNRFRELNKNGDIVASVTYNDGDELQVEKGWKIIFRNDWFGLGQNGNFIDKEKSAQASGSLDEETKFQGIAQWLAD